MAKLSKKQLEERKEATDRLLAILGPKPSNFGRNGNGSPFNQGAKLFTVLRHTAKSGMSRDVDVYYFATDPKTGDVEQYWLSRLVSLATGMRYNEKRNTVTVGGCGTDVGFLTVYNLSYNLYGDGYVLRQQWLG